MLRTKASEGVDFVCVNFFCPGKRDGVVEAGEQLRQSFAWTAFQHSQGVVSIGSNRHASQGTDHTHSDFAILDQVCDMR